MGDTGMNDSEWNTLRSLQLELENNMEATIQCLDEIVAQMEEREKEREGERERGEKL